MSKRLGEVKWSNGIADPGLTLETSEFPLRKLNWHFPAAWK